MLAHVAGTKEALHLVNRCVRAVIAVHNPHRHAEMRVARSLAGVLERGVVPNVGLLDFDDEHSTRAAKDHQIQAAGRANSLLVGRREGADLATNVIAKAAKRAVQVGLNLKLGMDHRIGDLMTHGLTGNDGKHRLGPLCAGGQLRPDARPRLLAQVLAPENATCFALKAQGLGRVHVPPASQALIEVLLVNTMLSRQPAAVFGGNVSSHTPHHSESLRAMQANRYALAEIGLIETLSMETAAERRRRKLVGLCNEHGLATVASKADLNPQALDQVIKGTLQKPKADGTRSPKNLGDKAARAIEEAFELGRGWFDAPDAVAATKFADLSPYEATLIGAIRDGLTVDELIQLIETVRDAIDTKNARVITGNETVTTGVYFGMDRRSVAEPVKQNRRQTGWTVNSPHSSGPNQSRGSKK